MIVTNYKKKQVRKAMLLIEQFLLKGENGSGNDRLYRQSKVPNIMLIRLKILVNFMQDYKKGIETAIYLAMLSKKPNDFTEDEPSIDAD